MFNYTLLWFCSEWQVGYFRWMVYKFRIINVNYVEVNFSTIEKRGVTTTFSYFLTCFTETHTTTLAAPELFDEQ